MSEQTKLLIIDEDGGARDILAALARNTYISKVTGSRPALQELAVWKPDLVLLKLRPPVIGGGTTDNYQMCREIRRESDVPLIALSPGADILDKVMALELGADDYIVCPFDARELNARVRALLRRCHLLSQSRQAADRDLDYPDLSVSLRNYSVRLRSIPVEMPPRELELLYFLASSPNRVFSREQLLDHIWGYEYVGDARTVDVHIKRLREKLHGSPHWSIVTVWGVGYKFEYPTATL